jgi:hypothetical protein
MKFRKIISEIGFCAFRFFIKLFPPISSNLELIMMVSKSRKKSEVKEKEKKRDKRKKLRKEKERTRK